MASSEVTERNSTKLCHVFGVSRIWKWTSKIWGSRPSKTWGNN